MFVCYLLCFCCGGQIIIFVFCVIGSHRSHSQHIVAQASHPLAKAQHVKLFCEHAGFCCKGWYYLCALVPIYQETSNVVAHTANTCMETSLQSMKTHETSGTLHTH